MSERQSYVLAIITIEQADALDVCPYVACGHLGSHHGVLATGCMVDGCPCGESRVLDRFAREAAASNVAGTKMVEEESIARGFRAPKEESS